ncbi:MAG: aminotransferase class I/II-fold pyridoxal phosphate-dependent enzyme [Spirochaetaceae bacterium]|jgi:aspartate/methionine/tyrosine aminotransferase|nr:aminotransferase class I/II-fold pyridoxal phosphate-dependent enzyme [Spirochaetaceae bacterium]
MNDLAIALNSVLDGTAAGRLLSKLGRRYYFPHGIIAQSTESKKNAHAANATIGMAYKGGKPLLVSAIADSMPTLNAEETVAYAPTAGVEEARKLWRDLLLQKNPSINPEHISLPVVVPGITAGISYMADLFLDEDTRIITSDPCWDNYGLIFRDRRGAAMNAVPFFGSGGEEKPGLDLTAIGAALGESAKSGAVRIILNFPNNPSGYSPTREEADVLVARIKEIARGGADVLVICDDAYFGLFYEEHTGSESLFARLASLDERVLAVKIDGPTKEDYAWGFRMAFVTFGSQGLTAGHFDALIQKLMGIIRSTVSCANTPVQHLMLRILADPRTLREKEAFFELLRRRYRVVKDFISQNPPHPWLKPLPFNSGYFMSFRCSGINADLLRRRLLGDHGIGVVAFGTDYLRVAFSSIDEELIPGVYRKIYDTAKEMGEGKGIC